MYDASGRYAGWPNLHDQLSQLSSTARPKITRSSADADNRLDAFSGQSRSTNMVPFHMLHMVSYCAIVTMSLTHAVFTIFVFKKLHDLEMGVKGHSRSLRVVSFDMYGFLLVFFSNFVAKMHRF